jgi:soluble lytic murein transglycosylase-like protein
MRLFAIALRAVLVTGIGFAMPMAADAEGLKLSGSKKNRGALFKSQTALLDGRLSKQYDNSVRLRPDYKKGDETADSSSQVSYRGNYKGAYLEVARAAARKHGVPEDLFLRLVQQESGWNTGAVSTAGATGLAQLMPATAARATSR